MNEPSNSRERELRVGARVSLDGRVGVLRYLYGTGAAVVRFDEDTSTRVVPVRRLVACDDEEMSTETPGGRAATVTFQGIEVTATKERIWHVQAAGRSVSAEFLDQALELALPRLSYEEVDSLLIRLLTATGEARAGASG